MKTSTTLLFLSSLFLYSCGGYKEEIKNNQAITTAKITGEKLLDVRDGYLLKYEYIVDNDTFTGESGKVYCDFSVYSNKNIPIVYSTNKPNYALILLNKWDYEGWGYEFPDSLKWLDCNNPQ